MTGKIAIIKCLFLLVPIVSNSSEVSILVRGEKFENDVWVNEPIYRYESLAFPKKLTKQLLQTSLQEYYNQYFGKTFRFMGDWRDFDHGHLINDEQRLRAILFHTQERANIAPRGSTYSYINKDLRNWLFFIENPTVFINAFIFRYDHKPAFWAKMYDKNVTWAEYEQAGTVAELMLDPSKIGFQTQSYLGTEKSEAIYFKKAKCSTKPPLKPPHQLSNLIQLETKEGPLCLYITNMQCTFKYHFKCTGVLL